jgi:transcriptional regulator with XRE-family HTH domain
VVMSLGDRMRHLIRLEMRAQRVKQVELAAAVGITQKHLSQMLNGLCGMSSDHADALLGALGREWTVGSAPLPPAPPVPPPALEKCPYCRTNLARLCPWHAPGQPTKT